MTKPVRLAAALAAVLLTATLTACGSGPSIPAGQVLLQQSGSDAEADTGASTSFFTPQGNFSVDYDVRCTTDGRATTPTATISLADSDGRIGAGITDPNTSVRFTGSDTTGTLPVKYSSLGDAKGRALKVHIEPDTIGTSCAWEFTVETA